MFQLKFDPIENIAKHKEYLGGLFESILPIKKEHKKAKFEFKFDNKTPLQPQVTSGTEEFGFQSENEQKTFTTTSDSITFTVLGESYENFEKTFSAISDHIGQICEKFGVTEFHRIAIRKINIIELAHSEGSPPTGWMQNIFNPALVNHLNHFPKLMDIKTSVSQVSLKNGDSNLIINYGLIPPQEDLKLNQYILDLDLYHLGGSIELRGYEEKFTEINNEIFNIFHWALNSEILQILKD